jgi:hypothetical protein
LSVVVSVEGGVGDGGLGGPAGTVGGAAATGAVVGEGAGVVGVGGGGVGGGFGAGAGGFGCEGCFGGEGFGALGEDTTGTRTGERAI